MAMSKKHYEAIAKEMKTVVGLKDDYHCRGDLISDIANSLADVFIHDNPRFNKATFFNACGLDDCGNPPH